MHQDNNEAVRLLINKKDERLSSACAKYESTISEAEEILKKSKQEANNLLFAARKICQHTDTESAVEVKYSNHGRGEDNYIVTYCTLCGEKVK